MKISVHLKPKSRHREEVVPNDDGLLTIYTKGKCGGGEVTGETFWCGVVKGKISARCNFEI